MTKIRPSSFWLPVLAAAVFAAAFPLTVQAQTDPVVAKVDGTEIRESDLQAAEDDIGAQLPPMAPDAKKDYLTTYVADMILVSKAAEAKKLGDTDEFKRKLALARTKLLMEALLQNEAKAAVTDEAMKKVYAEAIKDIGNEQEVSARHILVESEDEAKAIAADLKKGGNFDAIAKEKSKDPGSKDSGGDLGYFSKDQMVPEFAEAAFKLDKGQISDPVKSQFGWHIIRVDDKRAKQPPAFDQVKDQIENFVQRRAQAELIQKLRAEAKIEKLGEKPADPAAKPNAAAPAKK
ncbi:peptidylprolyl isomerase [Pseudorhodoplanes sp.]|uniref:peptidylprolyl isomerase n=1 Tax=Pseudorhodoplanes sp. TaxID=1934341 RepID=UPI00391C9785